MQIITVCGIRWHQWLVWQQHFFPDIFCFTLLHLAEDEIRQLLEEKVAQQEKRNCLEFQKGFRKRNLFFRYHVYFLRLQYIIKQLSDSVFVICGIINVLVRVICLAFGSVVITLTSTLITPHITKTSSNNCLL